MEDDLMFNFEDMNVGEDALNILKNEEAPDKIISNKDEIITNTETPSVEISETIETENTAEAVEIDDKTSKEAPSAEADSSQSTLYALAKYLKDEGVLFSEGELGKVDSIEDLKALVIDSHKTARFNNMNDAQKRYHEALENGVPVKEYETVEKDIQTFTSIKEETIQEDTQLQYELIAIDFMNQGIEKDKAMRLAQLSVNAEGSDSVTEAKQALESIITHKSNIYKELVDAKKEATTLDLKTIKTAIDGKKDILTMEVNENTKTRLFDLMTTKVGNDENGLPLNELQKYQRDNPVESNILMNYLFMMTNKGKDLGLIKTNTTSKATKELENKLKQLNFDTNGSLIIPDELISNNKSNSNNKENITINI